MQPANLSPLHRYPAPWRLQIFLKEQSLKHLPVYTLGIGSGATFAFNVAKAFWEGKWVGKLVCAWVGVGGQVGFF